MARFFFFGTFKFLFFLLSKASCVCAFIVWFIHLISIKALYIGASMFKVYSFFFVHWRVLFLRTFNLFPSRPKYILRLLLNTHPSFLFFLWYICSTLFCVCLTFYSYCAAHFYLNLIHKRVFFVGLHDEWSPRFWQTRRSSSEVRLPRMARPEFG